MSSEIARQLTLEDARSLTDQIRETTGQLCFLLKKAHDGRVWEALGYANWSQYTTAEFNRSVRHTNELVHQASVLLQLNAAAGLQPETGTLTEKRARRISDSQIPEAVDMVRGAVESGVDPYQAITDTGISFVRAHQETLANDPTYSTNRVIQALTNMRQNFPVEGTAHHAISGDIGITNTVRTIGPVMAERYRTVDIEDLISNFQEGIDYLSEVVRYLRDYLERS